MLYPLKDYFWPEKCPKCNRPMGMADKLKRMVTTVGSIGSVLGGKKAKEKPGEVGKCAFCSRAL